MFAFLAQLVPSSGQRTAVWRNNVESISRNAATVCGPSRRPRGTLRLVASLLPIPLAEAEARLVELEHRRRADGVLVEAGHVDEQAGAVDATGVGLEGEDQLEKTAAEGNDGLA